MCLTLPVMVRTQIVDLNAGVALRVSKSGILGKRLKLLKLILFTAF